MHAGPEKGGTSRELQAIYLKFNIIDFNEAAFAQNS